MLKKGLGGNLPKFQPLIAEIPDSLLIILMKLYEGLIPLGAARGRTLQQLLISRGNIVDYLVVL